VHATDAQDDLRLGDSAGFRPAITHGPRAPSRVREPDMTARLYARIMAYFAEHVRDAARRGTP
jgi:hypothetical protein